MRDVSLEGKRWVAVGPVKGSSRLQNVGRKRACGDTGCGKSGIYVGVQTEECTHADIYVGTNGGGGSEHPDSCEEYIFAWLE